MKTKQRTEFVSIPSVDGLPAFMLDPQHQMQLVSLIDRAQAYFNLAAKCWEMGNNSGNADTLARMERRGDRMRQCGEALVAPLGIKCNYPGLYPCFEVEGFTLYTLREAVLDALYLPRNFVHIESLSSTPRTK